MNVVRRLALVLAIVAVLVTACGDSPSESTLDEQAVQDLVWGALAPNTSSGDRANWQATVVEQVKGRDVADEFKGEAWLGCWKGPTPAPNSAVQAGADYWYVEMRPKAATPLPEPTISPTAPPFVPEPFLRQALFLIDQDGTVVARKLFCVIY